MTIGIEWVNDYHSAASNLSNNDDNARGFYNRLQGVRQFQYGDDLAWDQDFEQSGVGSPASGTDQLYADDVDIAFFSGHGSQTSLVFGNKSHDNGAARNTEMRLGDLDLEWIVFDGCQALTFASGAIWNRWGWPVFSGLHFILGFSTNCYDRKDRGEKFADRLNAGWTVRDSWIRACLESENSDVRWAYLRANGEGADTFSDHWWGKGSVSKDPRPPTQFFYLDGTC